MGIAKVNTWAAAAGALCAGGAILLYGTAPGPDSAHGIGVRLGTALFLALYAGSAYGWGGLLGGKAAWERGLRGSLFLALLPAVLGFLPLWDASFRFPWIAFLAAGWLFLPAEPVKLEKPFGLFLALGFAYALLAAMVPHPFWDSLWYHLTGPRLWYEAGRVQLTPLLPVALKGGLWDYHFLWAQLLLGGPGAGGLIPAQLFAQGISVLSALLCGLLLVEEAGVFGLHPGAALTGLLATELTTEMIFAKNDWGATLLALAAFAYLRGGRARHGSLAAGLAFGAKLTAGFFLAPLLLVEAWRTRRVFAPAALFLLGAAPVLLRNYLLTKDPFFPALHGLFPTDQLGPTWEAISHYEAGTFSPKALTEKLSFLLLDSPAVLGLFLLPFVALATGAKTGLRVAAVGCALFLFGSGPKAEWRLAGAALLLLGAYGAECARRWEPRGFRRPFLLFLALVCARMTLLFDVGAPLRLGREPAEEIRRHVSGAAMAWARMNVPPGAEVATLQEQRIYYLFPHVPRRVFDDPVLDRELHGVSDAGAAVRILRGSGIRYLVLSAEFLDRYYDRRICDLFYELSEKHPQAVVFRTELSRVLDLSLLK